MVHMKRSASGVTGGNTLLLFIAERVDARRVNRQARRAGRRLARQTHGLSNHAFVEHAHDVPPADASWIDILVNLDNLPTPLQDPSFCVHQRRSLALRYAQGALHNLSVQPCLSCQRPEEHRTHEQIAQQLPPSAWIELLGGSYGGEG